MREILTATANLFSAIINLLFAFMELLGYLIVALLNTITYILEVSVLFVPICHFAFGVLLLHSASSGKKDGLEGLATLFGLICIGISVWMASMFMGIVLNKYAPQPPNKISKCKPLMFLTKTIRTLRCKNNLLSALIPAKTTLATAGANTYHGTHNALMLAETKIILAGTTTHFRPLENLVKTESRLTRTGATNHKRTKSRKRHLAALKK